MPNRNRRSSRKMRKRIPPTAKMIPRA